MHFDEVEASDNWEERVRKLLTATATTNCPSWNLPRHLLTGENADQANPADLIPARLTPS